MPFLDPSHFLIFCRDFGFFSFKVWLVIVCVRFRLTRYLARRSNVSQLVGVKKNSSIYFVPYLITEMCAPLLRCWDKLFIYSGSVQAGSGDLALEINWIKYFSFIPLICEYLPTSLCTHFSLYRFIPTSCFKLTYKLGVRVNFLLHYVKPPCSRSVFVIQFVNVSRYYSCCHLHSP